MAGSGKSKKKKPVSGSRPSYAKGKPVAGKGGGVKPKKPAQKATPAVFKDKRTRTKDKEKAPLKSPKGAESRFNLIRSGTIEMKVFQVMLVFVVISILLQYPLWQDVLSEQYTKNIKEYRIELKKWEKEHRALKSAKKRAEHEKDKPVMPVKPTFSIFILSYLLMSFIQGALFLFIGLNIARRTDLETPLLDRLFSGEHDAAWNSRWLFHALVWSGAIFVPLAAAAVLVKFTGAGESTEMKYAFWKYSLHYAGFAAQNQFLFLAMIFSGLVWVFSRYRDKLKAEPHIASIIVTAAIAFLYFFQMSRGGHEKITSVVLVSFFFVASLVVIAGLLYWKKGLELSLISSFIGFALYPIFFSIIM